MIELVFSTTSGNYPVAVGNGIAQTIGRYIPPKASKVAFVVQESVANTDYFKAIHVDCESKVFVIPEGEEAKTFATIETLCGGFAEFAMTRSDLCISVGGGVVSDVGGFAASIYHRGMQVIHVPTTLLAQLDASLGGKTGINLSLGKNLVGTFWQPSAVICDLDAFATLPKRELQSGLGEMAKYHFIAKSVGYAPPSASPQPGVEEIAQCVAIKAAFVSLDEREGGQRALLNYGHTLAHALEIVGQFGLRHGEAVAVGLVFAAELARKLGRIDDQRVDDHRQVLAEYGLGSAMPKNADAGQLIEVMMRDKKALSHDGLTFVLDGPRGPEVVSGIEPDVVSDLINELSEKEPSN